MSAAASPAPSESENKRSEVAYRFCQECSNLLYPREDRSTNKLLYVCKACHSVQEHESACTYRTYISSAVQETAGVTTDVANDPTVGDIPSDPPSFCTLCGDCLRCLECGQPNVEDSDHSESSEQEAVLPHSQQTCPRCHETDAVYFQSQQRAGDTGMKLYYVCTSCSHVYTVV